MGNLPIRIDRRVHCCQIRNYEVLVRKILGLLIILFCSSMSPLLHADIAAIQTDKLPQETPVLAALSDAREMEPYSHVWWPEWNFPLSKKDVAKHLDKDMDSLVHALKKHPENEELALLAGLVARYGYNVDVKGSPSIALSALSQAETIDPKDVRASWFRATLLCQTLQPARGAHEFLSLEAAHPWDQFPPTFWIDYMECASLTNMPAHVLRAADHMEKLHGAANPLSNTYLNRARKFFEPFDPEKFDIKKRGRAIPTAATHRLPAPRAGFACKSARIGNSTHSIWWMGLAWPPSTPALTMPSLELLNLKSWFSCNSP
jgi:hypothetical protein